MPTLRIVYDVDGWAYHSRARALQKYAPPDFDVTIGRQRRGAESAETLGDRRADLVFAISLPGLPSLARNLHARGWGAKLVGSWNSGWPLQIPAFYEGYRVADALGINNRMAWERIGRLPRTFELPNGVDLDLFSVRVPIAERKPKVLWTGSHHGRRRKGYDDFILPLQRALESEGIECELLFVDSFGRDKLRPEQMAEWYNTGTVLVCASEVEGTPNPALEAAACGCTVVSTAVGNMPELIRHGVNGYLVERRLDALIEAVRSACKNHASLAAEMQKDIAGWSWKVRSKPFYDVFREVLDVRERPRPSRPDLSEKVTVFVTTVGAPSYQPCLDLVREQDCRFRFEIIEHVAPMSAAFQHMLDRCATPFFVQVDEDMLLYPHAVRTLYDRMASEAPDVAFLFADLFDAHLGRPIVGVKIYRHDVVRRYPFANVQSFEKRQSEQLKSDGYRIASVGAEGDAPGTMVLGLHGTHWTADSIFERYATLESRRRRHPHELKWFNAYPPIFLRRFLQDPNELNYFALMGVVSGAMRGSDGVGDKDFRQYETLPGLAAARRLFGDIRIAAAIDEEVVRLLEQVGMSVLAIEPVQSAASPHRDAGAFRIRLADGRWFKARILTNPGHAERMEYLLDLLDNAAFPKVLARRARTVLLDWIEGRSMDDRPGREIIEQCGDLHAALHLVPVPEGCPFAVQDLSRQREKLDADLAHLAELGMFDGREAAFALESARRCEPSACSLGLVHRDLCPENLIVDSDGSIIAVDNESLSLGAHDFDLARTWYRWPMERADRRIYLDAYARHRDVGPFLRHFPFWAIAVLADSARLRLTALPEVRRAPIGRLRSLLAALERGVAAEELVFEP